MHWNWQDLHCDCNLSFSQICNRVMALPWLIVLQHEKHYSGAIAIFSDNPSFYWNSRMILLWQNLLSAIAGLAQ